MENGLANTKEESVVTVTSDRDRFRLAEKTMNGESIEVFDGQTLYTKYGSEATVSAQPATLWECQSIGYDAVNESDFKSP